MSNKPTAELIAWHKEKEKQLRGDAYFLALGNLNDALAQDNAEDFRASADFHAATADRLAEQEAEIKHLKQVMNQLAWNYAKEMDSEFLVTRSKWFTPEHEKELNEYADGLIAGATEEVMDALQPTTEVK